ncbi:hypothetical protein RJ55_02177 [Drechmeria coniospora]|nr:hypothetical protein RJ55_02177 [Drechmeria coniospora]
MAAPKYSDEVQVVLRLSDVAGNVGFKTRCLLLSKDSPTAQIGRTSKRNSMLDEAEDNAWIDSAVMSRNHAELAFDADVKGVFITDIGSLHGTFRNGKPLVPKQRQRLDHGDLLQFGVTVDRSAQRFPPCIIKVALRHGTEVRPEGKPAVFRVPDDSDADDDYASDEDRSIESSTGILLENELHPLQPLGATKVTTIDLTSEKEHAGEHATAPKTPGPEPVRVAESVPPPSPAVMQKKSDQHDTAAAPDETSMADDQRTEDILDDESVQSDVGSDDGHAVQSDDGHSVKSSAAEDATSDLDASAAVVEDVSEMELLSDFDDDYDDYFDDEDDDSESDDAFTFRTGEPDPAVTCTCSSPVCWCEGLTGASATVTADPTSAPSATPHEKAAAEEEDGVVSSTGFAQFMWQAPFQPTETTSSTMAPVCPVACRSKKLPLIACESPAEAHALQLPPIAVGVPEYATQLAASSSTAEMTNAETSKAAREPAYEYPPQAFPPSPPPPVDVGKGCGCAPLRSIFASEAGMHILSSHGPKLPLDRTGRDDGIVDSTSAYEPTPSKGRGDEGQDDHSVSKRTRMAICELLDTCPPIQAESDEQATNKRKAAKISTALPDEEPRGADLGTEPVATRSEDTEALKFEPRRRANFHHHDSSPSEFDRPMKRIRKAAEVIGYVALGGVAVMSALIATAPAL